LICLPFVLAHPRLVQADLLVAGAHDASFTDAPYLPHLGAQLVCFEGILEPHQTWGTCQKMVQKARSLKGFSSFLTCQSGNFAAPPIIEQY